MLRAVLPGSITERRSLGCNHPHKGGMDLSRDAWAAAVQASSRLTHPSFELSLQSEAVMFKRGGGITPQCRSEDRSCGHQDRGTQPCLEKMLWEKDEEISPQLHMANISLFFKHSRLGVPQKTKPTQKIKGFLGHSWKNSQVLQH